MATLGELERTVMDVLWRDTGAAMSAGELRVALPAPAALTTVLTVLTRLEAKGFVERERSQRPHLFRAAMSRDDYMAELMHEVLSSAPDRDAVLARFVGRASETEAEQLRRLLRQA